MSRASGVQEISRARIVQGLQALHSEYGVYDKCGHSHAENDPRAFYIDGIGLTCEKGRLVTICRHCCTGSDGVQSSDCASDHDHLADHALCPTMAVVNGRTTPWRP
jgi:hypothetical protein